MGNDVRPGAYQEPPPLPETQRDPSASLELTSEIAGDTERIPAVEGTLTFRSSINADPGAREEAQEWLGHRAERLRFELQHPRELLLAGATSIGPQALSDATATATNAQFETKDRAGAPALDRPPADFVAETRRADGWRLQIEAWRLPKGPTDITYRITAVGPIETPEPLRPPAGWREAIDELRDTELLDTKSL